MLQRFQIFLFNILRNRDDYLISYDMDKELGAEAEERLPLKLEGRKHAWPTYYYVDV